MTDATPARPVPPTLEQVQDTARLLRIQLTSLVLDAPAGVPEAELTEILAARRHVTSALRALRFVRNRRTPEPTKTALLRAAAASLGLGVTEVWLPEGEADVRGLPTGIPGVAHPLPYHGTSRRAAAAVFKTWRDAAAVALEAADPDIHRAYPDGAPPDGDWHTHLDLQQPGRAIHHPHPAWIGNHTHPGYGESNGVVTAAQEDPDERHDDR